MGRRLFVFFADRFLSLPLATRRLILLGTALSLTTWSLGMAVLWFNDPAAVVASTSWGNLSLRHLVWGSRLLLLALWSFFFVAQVNLRPALEDFRLQTAQFPFVVAFFQALLHSTSFRSLYVWTSGYLFLLVTSYFSLSSALLMELLVDLSLLGTAFLHLLDGSFPRSDFYKSMALFGTVNVKKIPIGTLVGVVGTVVSTGVLAYSTFSGERARANSAVLVAQESTKQEQLRQDGLAKQEQFRQEAKVKREQLRLAQEQTRLRLLEEENKLRQGRGSRPPSWGWPWS